MEEPTLRIQDNQNKMVMIVNKHERCRETPLKLMKSPTHVAVVKKQAMIDKILGDLVIHHSFFDFVKKYDNASSKHLKHKLNTQFVARTTNRFSSNTHTKNIICEDEVGEEYPVENDCSKKCLKFTKAVQLSQSFVLIIDQKGFVEYANPYFQSVSGYTQDELIGKKLGFLISDIASHEEYEQLMHALSARVNWKGELVSTKKNGEWYIVMAKISPIHFNEENTTNFILLGQDITSFRETEIKLERAVREKSILLSELHHRVRDNLAIISGIMQLQALEEDNHNVKTKLFSSVGRVQALSNVHELLYESNDLGRIVVGENLKRVVTMVSEMFEDEDVKVNVTYDIEHTILNINQTHACTLILNEVVTNTYKQACSLSDKALKLDVKLITYGKKYWLRLRIT